MPNRRTVLTLAGTSAVGMSLLAGCSGVISSQRTRTATPTGTPTDTPTETPIEASTTHSYEAITGTWTGSTYDEDDPRFEHSHAKLEISKEDGTVGEEIGTLQLLVEEGGEVHCESTLTAHDAAPPTTFWLNVDGDSFPCSKHRRYRFQTATPDELEWYIRYSSGSYRQVTDLSRQDGREDGTPTTRG